MSPDPASLPDDPQALPPVRLRLPCREHHAEVLDGPAVPLEERSRSLRAMERVNRHLGGHRGLRSAVAEVARSSGRPVQLLDVGTGNGNVARRLAASLSPPDSLEWVGLDWSAATLRIARSAGPLGGLVQGDARDLPFADGSFDLAVSSLTLHHLDDPDVPRFLEELCRVARFRVLISDLERHPLHYAGARLLSHTVWRRDRVTRIDAPLSVLRSFTRDELLALGRNGPFRTVRVRRHFPFRLVLEGVPR